MLRQDARISREEKRVFDTAALVGGIIARAHVNEGCLEGAELLGYKAKPGTVCMNVWLLIQKPDPNDKPVGKGRRLDPDVGKNDGIFTFLS